MGTRAEEPQSATGVNINSSSPPPRVSVVGNLEPVTRRCCYSQTNGRSPRASSQHPLASRRSVINSVGTSASDPCEKLIDRSTAMDKSKEKMSKADTMKLRNKHVGKACQLFYRNQPLKIQRGKGQYMFDEVGARYLDCINNVAHVGHCHPKVVEAGTKQMSTLSTNNRFLHDEMVHCAEKIANKMPGDLSVCFFVNSGSEANDLALRLAKCYTGNTEFITIDHAYHGHLSSIMEISPYKFNQPGGDPQADHVHVVACPDTYRGKYNTRTHPNEDLGQLYAGEVDAALERMRAEGKQVAAFIAETFQSCGGQVIPPKNYFQEIYKSVRSHGGVVIADEVQVGFGRCGTHYWAFEQFDVVPDIVTIAKPMGNGHPVGAVVTTPEIADRFGASGISYFNTYGGNPVSCAIANAVMDVIEEEGLQQNALQVGEYLLEKCADLRKESKFVGDVRGTGLFIGIELIRDKATLSPATPEAKWVVDRMKNVHRVLVSSDGPDNNVIKLKPPMVFNMENANEFLSSFRECLTTLESTEIAPENLKAGNPHSFISGIGTEPQMRHVKPSHGKNVKSL